MIIIDTQIRENYGAHDWDGKGACPQYWKSKGGHTYKILGVPKGTTPEQATEVARSKIERDDEYFEECILCARTVHDNWMSDFERSQQEYEGRIAYPEPTLQWAELTAEQPSAA